MPIWQLHSHSYQYPSRKTNLGTSQWKFVYFVTHFALLGINWQILFSKKVATTLTHHPWWDWGQHLLRQHHRWQGQSVSEGMIKTPLRAFWEKALCKAWAYNSLSDLQHLFLTNPDTEALRGQTVLESPGNKHGAWEPHPDPALTLPFLTDRLLCAQAGTVEMMQSQCGWHHPQVQ